MSAVALISPGSLGVVVGAALKRAGHEILCDVGGRSDATRRRAEEAGFRLCGSMREATVASDVILSLVTPAQAVSVARNYACCARSFYGRVVAPIYIDGNSISPATAEIVRRFVNDAGARAVKAAFFGPSSALGPDNVIAFSGDAAPTAAALFGDDVETRIVGDAFNDVSAVKMSLSIITKTLPALFLESMRAAEAAGRLEATLALFERLYPGIASFLRRTLPTYSTHAVRRVDELREVEAWLRALGSDAMMTRGGRLALSALALYVTENANTEDFPRFVANMVRRQADGRASQQPLSIAFESRLK